MKAVLKYVEKPFEDLLEAEKLAMRYHLIVIAEALASLALHIYRRVFGLKPETPVLQGRLQDLLI